MTTRDDTDKIGHSDEAPIEPGAPALRKETMPDETTMSFDDVCAEIRSLLATIPPELWHWTRHTGTPAELTARVGEDMAKSDLQELYGLALADDALAQNGEARMVCYTGNGPNSEKHARLLMLVRAALPELLNRAGTP